MSGQQAKNLTVKGIRKRNPKRVSHRFKRKTFFDYERQWQWDCSSWLKLVWLHAADAIAADILFSTRLRALEKVQRLCNDNKSSKSTVSSFQNHESTLWTCIGSVEAKWGKLHSSSKRMRNQIVDDWAFSSQAGFHQNCKSADHETFVWYRWPCSNIKMKYLKKKRSANVYS